MAETIDPDAQRAVDIILAARRPPLETLPVAEARIVFQAGRAVFVPDPEDVAEVRDISAPGPAGPIPLRLYRGIGAGKDTAQPALVYFHGGGWVVGNLDSHDTVCRSLANSAHCIVVSVDYRLAPEHKFPAAVEDAIAATVWISANAGELGIDARRIAVGGDSAGGNLSAVVALHARDAGGPRLVRQLLIYPATDMQTERASYIKHAEQPPLRRATMRWFVDHYLGRPADAANWRASPLLAKDLGGLPPAFVLTAGFDPLCDEGEAYADALQAAGVAVRRERFAGQVHGFITMGRVVGQAQRAIALCAEELMRAFADAP